MTPNEIAQQLLNSLPQPLGTPWDVKVGTATVLVELTFRSKVSTILDIQAVAGCFSSLKGISAHVGAGSEGDESPRVVFEGGVGGHNVLAVFILSAPGE